MSKWALKVPRENGLVHLVFLEMDACTCVAANFTSRTLRTGQVSKAWEEVASVSVVGESIVIGRYQGGNISLKAALAPRRYATCRAHAPCLLFALCRMS